MHGQAGSKSSDPISEGVGVAAATDRTTVADDHPAAGHHLPGNGHPHHYGGRGRSLDLRSWSMQRCSKGSIALRYSSTLRRYGSILKTQVKVFNEGPEFTNALFK
jgi:hypothetical protein